MKDILLITAPFTQLNTPYPGTVYLKGFLNTKNIPSYQMDLGLEVILSLFSKQGLHQIFDYVHKNKTVQDENCERIAHLKKEYLKTIESTVAFLQGKQPSLARLICTRNYLPEASRFNQLEESEWAFGNMGFQDRAKHLATLYLEDLGDFITHCVDENFGFSRYAERLGMSANSFDELYQNLTTNTNYIDRISLTILEDKIKEIQPKLICFSVPFPGNLFSTLKCGQFIKKQHPNIKIAIGGGFPNTELREIKDERVFEFLDYIALDDGELPIELIYHDVINSPKEKELKRTYILQDKEVVYINNTSKTDYKQSELGTPDYSDLLLNDYISVIEVTNPMHSLWSDGRWNKLTMAHGCYWGKCTFCDISLDYIALYEPISAQILVDRMEQIIEQTGERGFHFVDEAAPPSLMKELAIEILKRELQVTWWTNIRFEKSFTADLCKLLAASGCIAVSGGLEVASDRLLELIQKGVSVEQVAKVCHHLTQAGIMVHAYLMYGYPTQTVQETIDSLEMVRQLFEQGIIQSGYWHQFALTTHSPVGKNPQEYGVLPYYNEISFANNDVQFKDKTGVNHQQFSKGLKQSLYNYMLDLGFDLPLQKWFDFKIPNPTVAPNYIQNCLNRNQHHQPKPSARILWLNDLPIVNENKLIFHTKTYEQEIKLESMEQTNWFFNLLASCQIHEKEKVTFAKAKQSFEEKFSYFEVFWLSPEIESIKELGLIVL